MTEKKLFPNCQTQTILREHTRERQRETVENTIVNKYTFETVTILKVHSLVSWECIIGGIKYLLINSNNNDKHLH